VRFATSLIAKSKIKDLIDAAKEVRALRIKESKTKKINEES